MKTECLTLLGGTFDPVHLGHINIARAVAKECQLAQVELMPCHLPPHRQSPGVSSEHRLNMVTLATAPYPELSVQPIELQREKPSYTADTVQLLLQQHAAQIQLIIGMDSLSRFCSWYQWDTILANAKLIVCQRPGYHHTQGDASALLSRFGCSSLAEFKQHRSGRIWLSNNQLIPVSATALRQALSASEPVSQWISPEVMNYIQQHRLYQSGR